MTKIQVTLTDQEAQLLSGYGDRFGYSLPKTAKFFLSKEVERIAKEQFLPVYPMSKAMEEKGLQAVEEYNSGKTITVTNIDEYFSGV